MFIEEINDTHYEPDSRQIGDPVKGKSRMCISIDEELKN